MFLGTNQSQWLAPYSGTPDVDAHPGSPNRHPKLLELRWPLGNLPTPCSSPRPPAAPDPDNHQRPGHCAATLRSVVLGLSLAAADGAGPRLGRKLHS